MTHMKNTWFTVAVLFIALTVVTTAVMIWALVNYFDQKNNVDARVETAVSAAVKQQADEDAAVFEEEEKKPVRLFAGPEDYGQVSFEYPKTWSVYVDKDARSGGSYQAYLNPGEVLPVAASQQYALRVTIEAQDYDKAISSYQAQVKRGDLSSSAVKINGQDGTRLDGTFSKDIKGSAVLFKIRDKTLTIRSDAETFKGDFETLIQTIKFNQ